MEREILIANTKTQKRNKITTNATTLAELKSDLASQGIDYSGMSFTEGISNTQLLDDNSQLPTNLNYKGHTTNNLVILLTNTQKNIPLGAIPAERAELFSFIKAHNLQSAVATEFGKNMTQVKTESLKRFVVSHNTEAATSSTPITPTASSTPTTPITRSTPSTPENELDTMADDILAQHGFINEPESTQEENPQEESSKEAKYIRAASIYNNEFTTIITALVQHLYDCDEIDSADLDDLVDNLTEVDE